MARLVYIPDLSASSGLGILMRSGNMQSFIVGAATDAADSVRGLAPDITVEPTLASGRGLTARWRANIINDTDNALLMEFGGRGITKTAPLRHILDFLDLADPNRHGRRKN